jgi:hypothetical protein
MIKLLCFRIVSKTTVLGIPILWEPALNIIGFLGNLLERLLGQDWNNTY